MFMNLNIRQLFAFLAALVTPIIMPAQEIPLLPGDPAVVQGVMPNGMSYYLVSNPTSRATADFALVQKTGRLTSPEDSSEVRTAEIAEEAFSSLKRVGPEHSKVCMAHLGVRPGKEGYAVITDDATVYRFNGVRLDISSAIDSTLLILMDIADRSNYSGDSFLRKWYSPADQAVIVAGDINPSVIAAKLTSMSYMMPASASEARPEYVMEKGNDIISHIPWNEGLTRVSATWTSKRAPREYMNTVQPEIFEMSLNTLGTAAVRRLKTLLKRMDIPAADVSYDHTCSSEYVYDDSFTLNATVRSEDADAAKDAIASVMSSIDDKGLMINEFLVAESSYILNLEEKASSTVKSNSGYLDICMNAFLYNASTASHKERLAFHTSRALPDTMRLRLFNGIASAIIDTLWTTENPMAADYEDLSMADTLTRPVFPVKVKLKSSRKEPVSGGVIWTFSNGIKVIYKKMDSDRMYYRLALNGGYGNIGGLEVGEGAFVSDYFRAFRVCGMNNDDFIAALNKEGLTMDMNAGLSNTMVGGSLPNEKMPLLMRSLLAVANERVEDESDYCLRSGYMALDMAQGSQEARLTAIDSIMCPGYRYSPYKVKGSVSDGFRARTREFYDGQFAKVNDGVLILAGNMNEEKLKDILLDYVGHFRTSAKTSRRTLVHYQPVSGHSTYTVKGAEDNVEVVYSARLPFTMDNNMAVEIASEVISQKLNELGIHFSLSASCRIYPEERANILISFPGASLKALADIRSALSDLRSIEITDGNLNAYKEALKHRIGQEMKSPAYWMHAIALRYLDGKDLSTGYAAKIDAVTPERVKAVLALLDGGSKVEYVTIKE